MSLIQQNNFLFFIGFFIGRRRVSICRLNIIALYIPIVILFTVSGLTGKWNYGVFFLLFLSIDFIWCRRQCQKLSSFHFISFQFVFPNLFYTTKGHVIRIDECPSVVADLFSNCAYHKQFENYCGLSMFVCQIKKIKWPQ